MLAVLTLLVSTSHADCMSGHFGVWPAPGETLAPGAELVLEADGTAQDRVRKLRDGDAVLVSANSRIPLEIVTTLTGSFGRTQVVVRPSAPFPPGERLSLELGGEIVEMYYDNKRQPASWTTGAVSPPGPPVWRAAPTVTGKERVRFGCGPDVMVALDAPVQSAVWLEATVWSVDSAERFTMRVPVDDGQAKLGHGMCSGPFELLQDKAYFAEITAIDGRGQRARADDSPLRFTAP